MRTLLSLFDYSGIAAQPFADAGWNVVQWDIKDGNNVLDMDSGEYFIEYFPYDDIDGILAFPPCTDFALSGAKHWKNKDAGIVDLFGRRYPVDESVELVNRVLQVTDWFYPTDEEYDGTFFWVMENPVGRLESFFPQIGKAWYYQPWEYAGYLNPSDSVLNELDRIRRKDGKNITLEDWEFIIEWNAYTKKTGLWGSFNRDIPKKPIEPVKGAPTGSVMQRLGGKSNKTKELRSNTPTGFSEAFWQANNDWRPETWYDNYFNNEQMVETKAKAGSDKEMKLKWLIYEKLSDCCKDALPRLKKKMSTEDGYDMVASTIYSITVAEGISVQAAMAQLDSEL